MKHIEQEEIQESEGEAEDLFKLIPFANLVLNKTPAYLVKDMIPRIGITIIWGPPKCGKSFLIFDLMMHVALGRMFRNQRVRQGPVVYCALEGKTGFMNRAEAFRRRKLNGDKDPPFHLMATPLALVANHEALIASIRKHELAPIAVVIDTLNRSIAGSESSDEDMGNYIKAADAVKEAFQCAVIIIHHCGYEGTRPRGHSSLMGALDAQIAISRDAQNNVVALVEYMKDGKDGPDGLKLVSHLDVIDLGEDDEGDQITSCVVMPVLPSSIQASAVNEERKLDNTFVRLLKRFMEQSRNVSERSGPNYAPKLFAEEPNNGGYTKEQFAQAMRRLLLVPTIKIEIGGTPSRPTRTLVLITEAKA